MPAGDDVKGAGYDPARRIQKGAALIQAAELALGGARDAPINPAPAGVANFDEFTRALVEIGLVDETELASFAADSAGGILGLSRTLIAAGKLTTYQAAAIYQKKTRGLLVGNYVILDKLGQGGMGKVFKARHRPSGRVGALKMLPPSFARDRSAVLRFRREVETAGLVKHPNLVATFDANEDRGVQFMVMDYVEGHDLDHFVREHGPMQLNQAIECLIQAACGLEAAHAKGIIHRDIKPGNLMLDHAGSVRVLDLGLARVVDAVNPFSKTEGSRLTESGVYMGTIDYMAPEQAQDSHRVDHRADIYSLGCTLYYLLTGQEPFWGETVLNRLMAHMGQPAPSLRILRPDVPPGLDAAYLKMMAKRPEDRPGSMNEVVALLEASKTAPDLKTGSGRPGPRSKPELMVFNEQPLKRAGPARTKADPSVFARPEQDVDWVYNPDLDLSDLVTDFRPASQPTSFVPAGGAVSDEIQPLSRARPPRRRRPRIQGLVVLLVVLGATSVALTAALVRVMLFSGSQERKTAATQKTGNVSRGGNDRTAVTPPAQAPPVKAATTAANTPGPEKAGQVAWLPGSSDAPTTTVDQRTGLKADVRVKEIVGWGTVIDPVGDCLVNANGGALTITVPATLHDLNAGIGLFNAPRVLREVVGDFDIQVRVVGDFTPGERSNREGGIPFNGAGIIVSLGGDSFVRLERGAVLNNGYFSSFAIFEQHTGRSGVIDHNGDLDPGTVYLRLARRGSRILGFTSKDGLHWTQLQPISTSLPGRLKVGLDAINSSSATFTARFEELLFKTGK